MKANRFFLILITILTISGFFQNSYTQWIPVGGPRGGRIQGITYNNKDLYVGTYVYGVFKSTNMGLNWIHTTLNSTRIECLESIGDTIIAGTTNALRVSTDAGNTWNVRGPNQHIWSITISGNYIFIAASYGLYYTTNLGVNWSVMGFPTETVYSVGVKGDTIFAGTPTKLYRSTNFGQNWTSYSDIKYVKTFKIKNNVVYAAGQKFYRSFDFGLTWISTQTDWIIESMCFVQDNIFISIFPGIYLSTDNGATFTQKSDARNVYALETASNNNIFGGAFSDGLYQSTDNGFNWFRAPFYNSDASALTTINNYIFTAIRYWGTGIDTNFYCSSNYGENWDFSTLYNVKINYLWTSGNNILVTAKTTNNQTNLYLSSNNGLDWQLSLNNQIAILAFDGNNIFIPVDHITYYSSNNGFNWVSYNSDLNLTGGYYVNAVAANGNILYLGYNPTYWKGIFRSTNSGQNWVQTPLNNKYIYSIVTLNTNVYAATNSGLYMSTNNGETWFQSVINFGQVYSLLVYGNNIVVGTDNSGVLLMNSEGTNFVPKSQGFAVYPPINVLKLSGNFIFAATDGLGVWRRSIADLMDINNVGSEIPDEYVLEQNYPNPFNSSTKIEYRLPSAGNVLLNVYDLLGREVAVLVNSRQNAGNHSVIFEAGKFSSGIYIYSLNVNGKIIDIKRAVHIK